MADTGLKKNQIKNYKKEKCINMITKEDIIEYFEELHSKCNAACPFSNGCSTLLHDNDCLYDLCDYITQNDN